MNFSTLARWRSLSERNNSISGRLTCEASKYLFLLGYLWVPFIFGYFKDDGSVGDRS